MKPLLFAITLLFALSVIKAKATQDLCTETTIDQPYCDLHEWATCLPQISPTPSITPSPTPIPSPLPSPSPEATPSATPRSTIVPESYNPSTPTPTSSPKPSKSVQEQMQIVIQDYEAEHGYEPYMGLK